MWAEIKNATEVSMGNPTTGTLILSTGLEVENCNPSFIWSDDSKFLAVAQYTFSRIWGRGKQKLLIIDVNNGSAWRSSKLAYFLQPETFQNEKVTVTINPFHKPKTRQFSIESIKDSFQFLHALPNKRMQSDQQTATRLVDR